MRFKILMLVVAALSFTSLVGCGNKCEKMCDDMQSEDCKDFDHDACMHTCIAFEDMQQDTDKCDTEYDDLMSCINDQSDIGKTDEVDTDTGKLKKCNSESEDFYKCVSDYCDDHTSRDYCKPTPLG